MSDFTPTQRNILRLLADGKPHARDEIHMLCCECAEVDVVRAHISMMRKVLAERGEDVVCITRNRRSFYQHVRLINANG